MACISAPPLVHPILLMGKVVQLGAYAEAEGQPPEDHCRHDPFFLPPGAEAFKRDNPNWLSASSTPATSPWKRMHAR